MQNSVTLTPENARSMFAGLPVKRGKELLEGRGVCICLYAKGGAGKTTLAGMMGASSYASPTLHVDAEGGAMAIAAMPGVDSVQMQRTANMDTILKALDVDNPPYKGLIIDNMTEIHSQRLAEISGGDAIGIQHYGEAEANVLKWTRKARNLARFRGINVIICVWEDVDKDQATGEWRTKVHFSNKLAGKFPGIVDMVGHISVVNNPPLYTRKLSFAPVAGTDNKFRRSTEGPAMDVPYDIYYGVQDNPVHDLLATLVGGEQWPKDKYARPVKKQPTQPS